MRAAKTCDVRTYQRPWRGIYSDKPSTKVYKQMMSWLSWIGGKDQHGHSNISSLAPLSRFRGSHITTAHDQQCCRFSELCENCAIANEIDKRN